VARGKGNGNGKAEGRKVQGKEGMGKMKTQKRKGGDKGNHYLQPLGTIIPPARGLQDVGFPRRGVEALGFQGEHAGADLYILLEESGRKGKGKGGRRRTSWTVAGWAEGLN